MPISQRKSKFIVLAKWACCAASAVRLTPHIILFVYSPKREYLRRDLERYAENYAAVKPRTDFSRVLFFVQMMTFIPEYRNVFYLRHRTIGHILGILCWPMASLKINAELCGPGLFIHHGFGTHVSVEEIGENCSIGQQVTVGYADDGIRRPTIGSNVMIAGGARVLGALNIGDNSRIGANSVVLTDVPPNVSVFGVPAKIVWRRNLRTARQDVAHL